MRTARPIEQISTYENMIIYLEDWVADDTNDNDAMYEFKTMMTGKYKFEQLVAWSLNKEKFSMEGIGLFFGHSKSTISSWIRRINEDIEKFAKEYRKTCGAYD